MTTMLEQLTLDFTVGGHRPDQAKLSITGKLPIDQQLLKGHEVDIQISRNGEVIAEATGTVVAIAFSDKTDKELNVTTTRDHKIRLAN